MAFCNANRGGQFGITTKEGNPLELFKFCSLSSFLIFRSSGPISWKSIGKNQTALSSCESEIMATKKRATELQSLKHRANGIDIPEAYSRTNIYNDKKAAVQWASSMTYKGIKNLNLRENMVHEYHQSKDVDVNHIPGIINPSKIFKKEIKDNSHLINIRDSMMVSLRIL